jgi:uncharacterized paraquat-inducible protein A
MGFIKWIVKKALVNQGLVMCHMCDESVATESKDVCYECSQELFDIEMSEWHRTELELAQ